ncbi:MAG TPA: hypothetical protein VGT01_06545 [Candidatus Dormibacteraeota bacterium]|nr:hypothetical protein [Candidatus Dormibacteraeota bacterium]
MAEHRSPRPTTLDSYDLEEVEVPLGQGKAQGKEMTRATRITIHGKNIFLRALEPTVTVGGIEVLYPRIDPDERTITGYLVSTPPEGAHIQLVYRGQEPVHMTTPFTAKKLKRR